MQTQLFKDEIFETEIVHNKYLPIIKNMQSEPFVVNEWDIPHTISELSYLTHNHYRYYGKFPSAVAGQLLDQFKPSDPTQYVLDNFCGSGTTLVEAKIRGIKSFGVDISWISALVSNVKSNHFDLKKISDLMRSFQSVKSVEAGDFRTINHTFAKKWFSEESIAKLLTIQLWLLNLPPSSERNFLIVGFLAILRRVSFAHDAEVRPHINANKKQRDVNEAFIKKINDMLKTQLEFQTITKSSITAECLVSDNQNLPTRFNDEKCYLLISHPPYLNSFNYRPVFSLEFMWGAPFEAEFVNDAVVGLNKSELIAHPANEKNTEQYFNHLKICYEAAHRIQIADGKLAVVIGDCTRNGELVPVIDRTIEIVKKIGYKLAEVNYRTTHYGLGKYAYKERADYHNGAEKRDAIIVFTK